MILRYDDIVLQVKERLEAVIPQGPPKIANVVMMENPAKQIESFFNKSSEQSQILITYSGNAAEGYKHVEAYILTLNENTQVITHTIEVHICTKLYMLAEAGNIPSNTANSENTMLRLMWLVRTALIGLKMYDRDHGSSAAATIQVTTPASSGDTLAGMLAGSVQLFSDTYTFVADSVIASEVQIATWINSNSYVTGFTATGSGGMLTVIAPPGASINSATITVGAITGDIQFDNSTPFAGGIDPTFALIKDQMHEVSNGGMFLIESFVDRNYPGVVCVVRFNLMEVIPQAEDINPAEIWGQYKEITLQEYSQQNGETPNISGSDNAEVMVP